jgi:homoserine dehydrogenase
MLETARRIAAEREIVEISGVLNGTCNFVLDNIASGLSREEAVSLAQSNGFAEADPGQDLDGSDAAQKLSLLANAAFDSCVPFEEIAREGILAVSEAEIRELAGAGKSLKLIARASRTPVGVECCVSCEIVPPNHRFASISGEENCLDLKTASGDRYTLRGRGAGRWPTAEAVFADLLDLWRGWRLPVPASEEELLVGGAA